MEFLVENPSFYAINKPTGLLTQSTYGVASVQTVLREQLAHKPLNRSTDDEPSTEVVALPFIEMPHRLDRGTSGVLLVARNRKALANLSQQFHLRHIRKRYWAGLHGTPDQETGTLQDWMRKIPDVAKAEIVAEGSEGAKLAVLNYKTLYRDGDRSIVQVEMESGRMHQIRLQFASRGLTVLGDEAYGSDFAWVKSETNSHAQHTALHAVQLTLRDPKNAEWIDVVAPIPSPWREHFPNWNPPNFGKLG